MMISIMNLIHFTPLLIQITDWGKMLVINALGRIAIWAIPCKR